MNFMYLYIYIHFVIQHTSIPIVSIHFVIHFVSLDALGKVLDKQSPLFTNANKPE